MMLTHDRTVDRRLVHKSAVENVFVTDTGVRDDGAFVAAVRFPRLHRSHADNGGDRHDLLLIAEVCRQAVAAIAHTSLGVPLNAQFVITDMTVRTQHRAVLTDPDGIVQFVIRRERRRRDGTLRAVTGQALCFVSGTQAASFEGTVMFLPAGDYAAMREHTVVPPRYAGPRAEPALVGRRDPRNVVITPPEGGSAELVADPCDPNFFDHGLDHLPGMLVLEGCRQLGLHAMAQATGVPSADLVAVACGGRFGDFAEFGTPVLLSATVEHDTATIVADQDGCRLATATVTVKKRPR